jgi:ABC-type multidrug transport system permease subunit
MVWNLTMRCYYLQLLHRTRQKQQKAFDCAKVNPVSEPGYFFASWWRTPLRHPPKVTIDQ